MVFSEKGEVKYSGEESRCCGGGDSVVNRRMTDVFVRMREEDNEQPPFPFSFFFSFYFERVERFCF